MDAPAALGLNQNPVYQWWRSHIVATVDHPAVVRKMHDEARWSGRYAFMTLMSAGIAVLGLLLSSPAVVIGAMLISPLMGPIIGLGFGLATFDPPELRAATIALVVGVVLAVGFSALIVLMSPLQNVTDEIAARTRPNLFDLLVALFSGLAGAYAMVRGREGTVVGVAIATALMPPLAVVGFGLATQNWTVFAGSTILFFTNLMTIVGSAAIVARFYGFGAHLSPRHTLLQTVIVVGSFLALAVPLGLSLRQIAWEAATTARAREVVMRPFAAGSRLSQLDVAYDVTPLRVTATVMTPDFVSSAQTAAARTLRGILGRPVDVQLEQVRVGTGAQAEAEQLASAQNSRLRAAERTAGRLSETLALVAGVAPDAVTIDAGHRRAIVTATPLPGAGLAAYRLLETRVAAIAPDWSVALVPPALTPPTIGFDGDRPDAAGQAALTTAAWAARRLNLPVTVTGSEARANAVATALREAGVPAVVGDGPGGPDGAVRLAWGTAEAP